MLTTSVPSTSLQRFWTPVPIVAVDHSNDSVAVQLRHEEINEVQTEHRAASTASLVKEDSVKWFKVCSDYIAPIYTFTKRTHKRTSAQALASALSSASTSLQTLRSVTNPVPSGTRARGLIVAKSSPKAVSVPATQSTSSTNTSTAPAPTASISSTPAQLHVFVPVPTPHTATHTTTLVSAPTPSPTTATTSTTSTTWLAPLLRARQVSEQHIQLCEQALVRDEGFTDASLFAALPAGQEGEMVAYLNRIGITPKGVQMKIVDLHKTLLANNK